MPGGNARIWGFEAKDASLFGLRGGESAKDASSGIRGWLLKSAHRVLVAQLGPSHGDTREARARLFALYTAWGKPQEAAAFAPMG